MPCRHCFRLAWWREEAGEGVDSVSVGVLDPFGPGDPPLSREQRYRAAGFLGIGLGVQFSRRYMINVAVTQDISSGLASSSRTTIGGAIGFGK